MTWKTLVLALAPAILTAAEPAYHPLFNGKDLDGWKMTGPGQFVIENGLMKTEGGMGLLYYTRQKFGNCRVRVVFKTASEHANSGVIIRLPDSPKC